MTFTFWIVILLKNAIKNRFFDFLVPLSFYAHNWNDEWDKSWSKIEYRKRSDKWEKEGPFIWQHSKQKLPDLWRGSASLSNLNWTIWVDEWRWVLLISASRVVVPHFVTGFSASTVRSTRHSIWPKHTRVSNYRVVLYVAPFICKGRTEIGSASARGPASICHGDATLRYRSISFSSASLSLYPLDEIHGITHNAVRFFNVYTSNLPSVDDVSPCHSERAHRIIPTFFRFPFLFFMPLVPHITP